VHTVLGVDFFKASFFGGEDYPRRDVSVQPDEPVTADNKTTIMDRGK